jgi:hypothetical protein
MSSAVSVKRRIGSLNNICDNMIRVRIGYNSYSIVDLSWSESELIELKNSCGDNAKTGVEAWTIPQTASLREHQDTTTFDKASQLGDAQCV